MHLQGYDLVPCVKWFPCLHQPSNPSHWLNMEDKRDSVREGWSHGCEGSLASERQTNHALGFFFLFSEGMWEDSLGVSWGKMGLDWYLYCILASKKKKGTIKDLIVIFARLLCTCRWTRVTVMVLWFCCEVTSELRSASQIHAHDERTERI